MGTADAEARFSLRHRRRHWIAWLDLCDRFRGDLAIGSVQLIFKYSHLPTRSRLCKSPSDGAGSVLACGGRRVRRGGSRTGITKELVAFSRRWGCGALAIPVLSLVERCKGRSSHQYAYLDWTGGNNQAPGAGDSSVAQRGRKRQCKFGSACCDFVHGLV